MRREVLQSDDDDDTTGQFHQHFMHNFYVRRSQKRKKLLDLTVFFALLGSLHVKAVRLDNDEIDPSQSNFGTKNQISTIGGTFDLLCSGFHVLDLR